MSREIKFKYIYQHDETGRITEKTFTIQDIEGGETCQGGQWSIVSRRQSTGLTDKNGKDIYEGDILMGKHKKGEYPRAVEFYKGMFVLLPNRSIYYDYILSGEIVGNIHENPELMEG